MQRQWSSRLIVLLIGTSLPAILSGCLFAAKPGVAIHESKQGSVSLEYATDHALQATHPFSLDPHVLDRVLRGMQVQERESVIEKLFVSEPKRVRAFSDNEAAFLTPLLANALTQATPEQEVRFRVVHQGGHTPVTTGGSLYLQEPFLYLTLTHYHAKPYTPDTIYMPNRQIPGSTGVSQPTVSFIPDPLTTVAPTSQPVVMEQPDPSTLVINYKALGSLPQPKAAAVASPPPAPDMTPQIENREPRARTPENLTVAPLTKEPLDSDELRRVKDLVIKKDLELEALKDETRALRQQLSEREVELQTLKNESDILKKKPPTQRSQKKIP